MSFNQMWHHNSGEHKVWLISGIWFEFLLVHVTRISQYVFSVGTVSSYFLFFETVFDLYSNFEELLSIYFSFFVARVWHVIAVSF